MNTYSVDDCGNVGRMPLVVPVPHDAFIQTYCAPSSARYTSSPATNFEQSSAGLLTNVAVDQCMNRTTHQLVVHTG